MDHTGIIPSMEETLFKPCVEGMDEILVEIVWMITMCKIPYI